MIDPAVTKLEPVIGTKAACASVGRARATHYRRRAPKPDPSWWEWAPAVAML